MRIEEMDSYVYCGLITDESIEEVYVNGEETALVDVGNRHRVWYSLSKIESSAKIKAIKTDGTEEWLKEM